MIYLDTHVIVWLYAQKGTMLSKRARQFIEDEAMISISPMVLLELDYLNETGRTTLGSGPVYDYLHKQMDLRLCQKPFQKVIRFASQQTWTRDPFDRIIVAQAAIDSNTLITKDELIREHYAHAVW